MTTSDDRETLLTTLLIKSRSKKSIGPDDNNDNNDDGIGKIVEKVEAYFYKRQILDFVLILGLVIVGGLYTNSIDAFCRQKIFKSDNPKHTHWLIVALVGTIIFLLALRILKTPVAILG